MKGIQGRDYPTYFKLKGSRGKLYKCISDQQSDEAHLETDARDDYFRRRIERREFRFVYVEKGAVEADASCVGPNLKSGIATVMASLPEDVEVGDVLTYTARVEEPARRLRPRSRRR